MANNNKKEAAEAAASLKEKQNFLATLPETATDSEREFKLTRLQFLCDNKLSQFWFNA